MLIAVLLSQRFHTSNEFHEFPSRLEARLKNAKVARQISTLNTSCNLKNEAVIKHGLLENPSEHLHL